MKKNLSKNSPEVKNNLNALVNKSYPVIPVTETLTNGFFR